MRIPVRRAWRRATRTRARGALTAEYAVVMGASLLLFGVVGELFRLSLIEQTLARATHEAARAAAADPFNCATAIADAFAADSAASWLLDLDEDGTIGIAPGHTGSPDNSSTSEVLVGVSWDGNLADGVSWTTGTGCGPSGSWMRVRAAIVVQPWFGPVRAALPAGGIPREHTSWARNQG
ncbi:MAG: hypothetical protein F4X99_01780 [Gammaproteobacteria bacterium]|nr:hypothetical protein [Gammaproteobacteria bacterium]